jgi:hypothetical protein
MGPAIPAHLRCPRTRLPRIREAYRPTYPTWGGTPRFVGQTVKQAVMAYLGVQHLDSGRCAFPYPAHQWRTRWRYQLAFL